MTKHQEKTKKENSHSPNGMMKNKRKVITIVLLVAIVVSSSVALFMLPCKAFFSVLLVISLLGLTVAYFIYGGNKQISEVGRKKYSNLLIVEELDWFFSNKKPYLNSRFKISDLEKQ
ncbi:MAG: hypothetical protein LBR10_15145, partial [Prevotellaceae bacterium]|nr:hypothetical protein [Prevotellaceae bacterium]